MTTLQPRPAYTAEELKKLYPESLQLQFVQILLRHGERSPVSARFQSAGLAAFWPYCSVARSLVSTTMNKDTSSWSSMEWRRRLETFGADDGPVLAEGPQGEVDAICNLGELTDQGRRSTHALGTRLRRLYVDQLGFMPQNLDDADSIYLRATPIPRALESLQETFWGLYPYDFRSKTMPPPTIITRAPADETLFPNDGNCRRFAQLSRAFAQRTADRWNDTDEMAYLNKIIGKWMPEGSKTVAVDSHPRLSGIMDTINSTLAHPKETRLPKEFYDEKGRAIIDTIGVEEWFSGYKESREYRMLGIGGLMGDIVSRMVGSAESNSNDGITEVGGMTGSAGIGRGGEKKLKLGLSGCHDTTLAAILTSIGAFDGEKWPPYTSHVAVELFRKNQQESDTTVSSTVITDSRSSARDTSRAPRGWLNILTGGLIGAAAAPAESTGIARRKMEDLSTRETAKLNDYFVRIRYNDKVMSVPGCKAVGKHLEGDESFCTLEAFKSIVDKFTPAHWKLDCASNRDQPAFPAAEETAGY